MAKPNPYMDPKFNPNMTPAGFNPAYGAPMPNANAHAQGFPDPSAFPQGVPFGGSNPSAGITGMAGMPPMGGQPMPGNGFVPDMGVQGAPVPDFQMGQSMPVSNTMPVGNPTQMPAQSNSFVEESFSIENMASPQDIYNNQAAMSQQAPTGGYPEQNTGFADPTFSGGYAPENAVQGAQPGQPTQPAQPGQMSSQSARPWQSDVQMPQYDVSEPATYNQPQSAAETYSFTQETQWIPDMASAPSATASGAAVGQAIAADAMQVSPDMRFAHGESPMGDMGQFAPEQFGEQMFYQQFDNYEQPNFYDNVIIEPIDPDAAASGKATLSLILGILSIIFIFIPPVGIVLGAIARHISKRYKRNGGESGAATVGGILGLIGFILSIIACVALIAAICLMAGASFGSGLAGSLIQFYNSTPLAGIAVIPYSYF